MVAQSSTLSEETRFLVVGDASGGRGRERYHRLDVPCAAVGFTATGFRVHIRFSHEGTGGVTLTCHASPHRIRAVSQWIEAHGKVSVRLAPGLAPMQVHAHFPEVPAAWSRLVEGLGPTTMEIAPDGTASIFTRAPVAALERYCASLPAQAFRVRPVVGAPHPQTLSPRQREALDTAVALGYYDIPHAVTLRDVAARMGLGLGGAAELLRRAEAAIMQGYADAFALSQARDGPAFLRGPPASGHPGDPRQATAWGEAPPVKAKTWEETPPEAEPDFAFVS